MTTGKHCVERGEQDRQRTSRRESNSGRRERSCAVCQRSNHEAIGSDKLCFLMKGLITASLKVFGTYPNDIS